MMHGPRRLRIPFTLLALSVACAQDDVPTADLIFDHDNVIPVTNPGPAPSAHLDLVVSIGPKTLTDTGSPDEFGRVSSVALGPDEEVFVADRLNREIRVFGLDGIHHRTFGRMGEGPGEFQSLNSLVWAGDRLLSFDPDQGRIGEWSAAGEWLGQRATQTGVTGTPEHLRLYPVGPDEVFRRDLEGRYLGINSRGETGDTLASLRGPSSGPPAFIECKHERSLAVFDVPFAPRFLQHPGPGGVLYSALTSDYRIFVTRNDGIEVLMVIERTLPGESFSDDEWRAANEEYHEWRESRRGASCDPREPTRPAAKPFIEDLFVAPDGKLWVEVVRTAGNRWEVFDTEGKLLGSVPAPPRGPYVVPAFGADYLLTIRRDSLDLDHVDVWRFVSGTS